MDQTYAARVCLDGRVQTVKQHTLGVMENAGKDAELLGCPSTVSLVCLLHDMGKNTAYSNLYQHTVGMGESWQKDRPIHSHAGAKYIFERYGSKDKIESDYAAILSEIVETVIMSHHGLFDCVRSADDKDECNGLMRKIKNTSYDYDEAVHELISKIVTAEELDTLFNDAVTEVETIVAKLSAITDDKSEMYYYMSMFCRTVLSVLVNADHTDAAEFTTGERIPCYYGARDHWEKCCKSLERKLAGYESVTPIQRIRGEISEKSLKAADRESTIVRLSIPTGGGKTLSGLRYALNYAKKYDKSRVVYVAPFNSILEQNAAVFKQVLPKDVEVLEHFGDLIDYEDSDSGQNYRYYTENWGSRIIATSMVQFLNSLFSGKIGSVRRMRGLLNSVIILDEVQSVPIECLSLFNLAVNYLAVVCGCTVVLCSATQPALDSVKHKLRMPVDYELIDDYKVYEKALKRTRICDSTKNGGFTSRDAAEFAVELSRNLQSVLMIVNTKAVAKDIYQEVKSRIDTLFMSDEYYIAHLSTGMCPAHRKAVMLELRASLRGSKKVICVSTQLIEAGVDISFATVVRSLAGLDSIIQAAGRCNRNMEEDLGKVHIINIADENISKLRTIKIGGAVTRELLATMKKNSNLFDGDISCEAAVRRYYEKYYHEIRTQLDYPVTVNGSVDTSVYQLLSLNVDVIKAAQAHGCCSFNSCLNQSFKTAGEEFKAIVDYQRSVVVPYGKGKELIGQLCSESSIGYDTRFFRKLQQYSIGLSEKKCVDCVTKDEETGIMILKDGYYHEDYGFDENYEPETLFI